MLMQIINIYLYFYNSKESKYKNILYVYLTYKYELAKCTLHI